MASTRPPASHPPATLRAVAPLPSAPDAASPLALRPLAGRGGIWRAFNALYQKYVPFVRRFLSRRRDLVPASVEDLIQKSFTTVNEQMEKLDAPLANSEAFVVKNRRARGLQPHAPPQAAHRGGGRGPRRPLLRPDPERMAQLDERADKLHAHLDAMEEDDANLIRAVDLLGLTYAEVGAILGCPLQTVATQYHRARKILNERIRAEGSGG